MEKRQHRCDVPVFGIINFKFVNTSYVVQDFFFKLKKKKVNKIFISIDCLFLLLMIKNDNYLYYLQHTITVLFLVFILHGQ